MILVTGGAGFIGSEVIRELTSAGLSVLAIDNFDPYYDPILKRHRWETVRNSSNVDFVEGSILDEKLMRQLFGSNKFDGVINLAAMAGVRYSIEKPEKYISVNTLGSLRLLELMREFKVNNYVMASTSSLYAGCEMPFTEDSDVRFPLSPYASSKLGAETAAYTYNVNHGISVKVLRYFTVYGPAGRPDMSPFRFIEWVARGEKIQLYGDGKQSRDFTYVSDVAKATVSALQMQDSSFEIINIGGGAERTSILELIQLIEKNIGRKAHIDFLPKSPGDMLHTSANIDKANSILGWSPTTSVEEGIELTVSWHMANQDWLTKIDL